MKPADYDKAWDAMKNCSDPAAKAWLCRMLQDEGRAVGDIKRMLAHELGELELALNRETPNLRFVSSRVRNIRNYMEHQA